MIQKKICLLGASGVGKTSLVRQYIEGIFDEKYLTSIGVKIDKKLVDVGETTVQLMLWDIEGVDKFSGFQPRYLRGAAAFIIVTDRSREGSLQEGMKIMKAARDNSSVPAVLAINKCDLDSAWTAPEEELEEFRSKFIKCFDTSAKTGQHVEDMFKLLATELVSGN